MSLVVHIGYHKTGSTALQKYLVERRPQLEERLVFFPPSLSNWLGHPEIPWSVSASQHAWQDRNYDFNEVLSHYAPWLEKSKDADATVIISSEEFCRCDFFPDSMDALARFFAPYGAIIVGFVREPLMFLLSRYRHEVQHGSEKRNLADFLSDSENIASASFSLRTKAWQERFPGSCIFRSYEHDLREDGSVVSSFLKIIGVENSIDAKQLDFGDSERKMHPVLLDMARLVAGSDLPAFVKEELFDQAFAMSDRLPKMELREMLLRCGFIDEVTARLGAIPVMKFDTSETISTIINSRA